MAERIQSPGTKLTAANLFDGIPDDVREATISAAQGTLLKCPEDLPEHFRSNKGVRLDRFEQVFARSFPLVDGAPDIVHTGHIRSNDMWRDSKRLLNRMSRLLLEDIIEAVKHASD